MADPGRWWGEFDTPLDQWSRWLIGPLSLWARASAGEWRLSWHSDADRLLDRLSVEMPATGEPDNADETTRYALADAGNRLRLTPRLADRPVVVRPETPLVIPSGQNTVLFVGTSLWVRIESLAADTALLTDVPIFRPSDTWFGSNTRIGELCYASRTKARTSAELLGRIPHRAVTPVEVINKGADALPVSQLRIPVQALSLFEAGSRLWTDGIRFTRELNSTAAEFEIDSAATYVPENREVLAAPQRPIAHKSVMEVFSSLF
ncbi:MAG: hypothetical protein HKO55_01480 [Gammaproteobacteria bacterium]|nr:hypothetical protein [Gammaproteobacteria bacterium]NNM19930.1 hypothetical protein [Gammaproteobacteria bacterium]